MGAFVDQIRSLERERNALHRALHLAFTQRDHSPQKRREWIRAAERFRNDKSSLDPLIERCLVASGRAPDPVLREFMFDYIEVDPFFFRSGYLMERILRRVKRLELTSAERSSLRALLLKRIRNKGMRNFRDICRLLPLIEDAELNREVKELSQSNDRSVRHRAGFALGYFTA